MIKTWIKNIGPGPLVAAAFIGPGTVTLCTLAGAGFGYALLWAMLLSVAATIVLQETAARLGIVSQRGLSGIIKSELSNPTLKWGAIILILSAIVIGNAAYEAGNISGGVLGLEAVFGTVKMEIGTFNLNLYSLLIGIVAFVILYMGNYKILERVLIALVVLMSIAFLITAIMTKPDVLGVLKGAFIPKFPQDSILIVIGLIGTTVVPYNLFLHASLVKEKWHSKKDLRYARIDTVLAVFLGGLVSMCIIIAAAALPSDQINNAADLAKGLEPLFGEFSTYFLALGLFAAGITSAITAPLAAAFVCCGCLGWSANMKSMTFRAVWIIILLLGVALSSLNLKHIEIIKFAQVANGALLPVIAIFLIWLANRSTVLGKHKNSVLMNILSLLILLVLMILSLATFNKVFNLNIF